ncbi:ATP-binding protein [Bradyrhizobium sp. CB3481]|uniref:ATP-binding protein n=1 Tax=Bradyrhizobium sp. CB3481 TaxID=3039158 RepID=UPI0024B24406|nr:ATP-binding protein [Bradyrhizobium sp. CB3481]WFU15562.1 MASE1 domain-containing protein [Bradyrhizobium sp. CB3481]
MELLSLEEVRSGTQLVHRMSRSHLAVGLAYIASYVVLDALSYIHPFAVFGVTPWNPQAGLSFALILLLGRQYLPWLFVAQLLADLLVRRLPLPPIAEFSVVLITGLGYGTAALFLTSPRMGFDPTLSSRSAMLWLIGVAVVSIGLVSVGYVLVLLQHGFVTKADLGQVFVRAFVGDLIGVMVFTPFLLIAFTRRQFAAPSWEMGVLMLIILAAVWGILSLNQPFRFQLFYVLFLPIVWIAVRFGLPGATAGLVVTQIGLIVSIELTTQSTGDVVAYQALMVILAITGLAVGVLVTEQRRTQNQLRLHQDALHRASRVATMGEFAATVAHEITQPLTAIGNYARLAKFAAERSPPDLEAAAKASTEAIVQVDRAGEVVNRLRDFISVGRVETGPAAVSLLIDEALSIFRPDLDRRGIVLVTQLERDLPSVLADALQVEQVILNLVRNAAEALTNAGRNDGRIVIEAAIRPSQMVTISVTDNGPGLDPDLAMQSITAFATTKRDGLGLGLSLSRSIIEAHGGQLHIEGTSRGVCASFTLPIYQERSVGS